MCEGLTFVAAVFEFITDPEEAAEGRYAISEMWRTLVTVNTGKMPDTQPESPSHCLDEALSQARSIEARLSRGDAPWFDLDDFENLRVIIDELANGTRLSTKQLH